MTSNFCVMNELNLQNPEFLKYIGHISQSFPDGEVCIVLRTKIDDLTILRLHRDNKIFHNLQCWWHPGCNSMSSFEDLENYLKLVPDPYILILIDTG